MTIKDRVTFRPTPADLRHIEAVAETLRATSGTVFVSRSGVLRLALRVAAQAAAQAAAQVPSTPAAIR
jgi:hypothetical protein